MDDPFDGGQLTVCLVPEADQELRCLRTLREAGLQATIEHCTPTAEDPVVVVAVPCGHRPTHDDTVAATARVTRALRAAGLHAEVQGTGHRTLVG